MNLMDVRKRVLNFPDAVADALGLFVEIASPFGIADHALLGDGTVLAARWRHRLSTYLDFFMAQASRQGCQHVPARASAALQSHLASE